MKDPSLLTHLYSFVHISRDLNKFKSVFAHDMFHFAIIVFILNYFA